MCFTGTYFGFVIMSAYRFYESVVEYSESRGFDTSEFLLVGLYTSVALLLVTSSCAISNEVREMSETNFSYALQTL